MATHFNTISWANSAVIYEVNIRQYTPEGTFAAFAKHLPRLKQMGVDVLWLMPITPISFIKRQGSLGSYYACSSYTKINEEFGIINDFKSLVNAAHQLGLKVIIDWVANHTGCDHEWTKTNKDFYRLDADENFTERNGWNDVIDLNYDSAAMRNAIINAMKYWIKECDIDGFRCDMAHLVPLEFWNDARQKCDAIKPLFWLAETEQMDYHNVFDVSYAWAWMHETEKLVKGENSLNDVYNILHQYSQYPAGAKKLFFTANHDENSWTGTEYDKYGKFAKAFAVFTFTWQGTPLIYSGQEAANKKQLAFFDKDLIAFNNNFLLQNFYTTLSSLHKLKAITDGEIFILPTQNNAMAYLRKHNENVVLVMLNLSKQDRVKLTVNHEWLQGSFTSIFSGLQINFNKQETFELMSGDYIVLKNF